MLHRDHQLPLAKEAPRFCQVGGHPCLMGLRKVWCVVRRKLWLQSLRRHFLSTTMEVVSVVMLAYCVVPSSAPAKAALRDGPQASPIIGDATPAYYMRSKTSSVVYGPRSTATDVLVQAAFQNIVAKNDITAVANRSDVLAQCVERWSKSATPETIVCIEFLPFGSADNHSLGYHLHLLVDGKLAKQFPLSPADSFRLERKDRSKTIWENTLAGQSRLDYAYLESQKAPYAEIAPLLLRPLPEVPPAEDVRYFRATSVVLTMSIYCIPFMRRIAAITAELSTGLKDHQRINGLALSEFWFGHFLSAFAIQMFESVLIMAIMLYLRNADEERSTFFSRIDVTLLLFVMVVFNMCHIVTAMLIAAVCKNSMPAVFVGVIAGFLIPSFDNAVTYGRSGSLSKFVLHNRWSKLRTAIYPQLGGSEVLKTLAIFDDYEGGARWGILFKRAMGLDSITLFELLSVMLGVCALNVFLLFYLSNVLPWATEYPQHPLFCLMPGYWLPGRTVSVSEEVPSGKPDGERFQELSEEDAVVDIRGLTKVFGQTTALDGVNLKIYASQVTVLVGHNGAGKTTLMSALAGFLSPTSGSIKIIGSDGERAKKIAFCPQFDVLFSDLTVVEHINYYGQLQGLTHDLLSKSVSETLRAVHLVGKQYSFPNELSGGMRRRLSLSISLVAKPKLLILDEPTTGMDPDTRRSIWRLIGSLRGTSTILLSTHDMEEADVLADRIVMMNTGKLLCAGSPTFLKKACGVGYTIHLSTTSGQFQMEELLGVINEVAPNAVFKDEKEEHVSIPLQTLEHAGFAAMFRKLEELSEELGIKSIGLTVATMRDAYITINKLWVPEAALDNPQAEPILAQNEQQELAALCTDVATSPSSGQRVQALLANRLIYWWRSPIVFLGWVLTVALFVLWCAALRTPPAEPEQMVSLEVKSQAHFGGAQCFVQALRETELSRHFEILAKLEGATVTRMQDAQEELVDFARKDFIKYYSHYAYGLVDRGITFEGWYNPASPVSRNVLLNLIGTAMLRTSSESPTARISTQVSFHSKRQSVRPLTATQLPAIDEIQKLKALIASNNDFWSGWPAAVLGLATCAIVSFPTAEKLSRLRDLQLMTGISGRLYVVSHFIFDLLILYLLPFGCCFAVYAFWYAELQVTTLVALYVIMVAFAPVAIFELYLVAHLVHSEGGAYSCAFALFVLAAPMAFIAYNILRPRISAWWLRPIFMLSAPFALNEAALNAVNLEPAARLCAVLQATLKQVITPEDSCRELMLDSPYLGACCMRILKNPHAEVYAPGAFSLSAEGVLPDVVYFVCQGVLLFIVLSVLHSGYAPKFSALASGGAGKPALTGSDGSDRDVRAEKELAKRLASSGASSELEREGHTLVACDLCKTFRDIRAVRGLSLALRSAECFGLLGVGGAGKSTTFQMLAGLLEPSEGSAYMADVSLSASPRTWQSFIGYCPQSNAFLEKLTAYEHLRLLAQLRGIPEPNIDGAVRAAIAFTDLKKHAAKPSELQSGGSKRKLSVALSLLGKHRAVFLDEPFAGIDVVARTKISRHLAAVPSASNTAIVLTSQGMEECEALCDRLCIMVSGKMACLGTLQHLRHKFGIGYTMQLGLKPSPVSPDRTGGLGDIISREKTGQELDLDVAELFPGVRILSTHDNMHDYHMTKKLPWSTMFEKIEELEKKYTFSRVLIEDTNLEQIFIGFAQDREVPGGA